MILTATCIKKKFFLRCNHSFILYYCTHIGVDPVSAYMNYKIKDCNPRGRSRWRECNVCMRIDTRRKKKFFTRMLHPGYEPGLPRPQRGVLTTRLMEQIFFYYGDTGFRSRCLALAKRALFQLSYTPIIGCYTAWRKNFINE